MAIISNGTTIASGGSLSVSANPPSTAGNVGTYAFVGATSTNTTGSNGRNFGETLGGSNLLPRAAGGYSSGQSARSGTWRCMGYKAAFNADLPNSTTLWIRIS